MGKGPLKTAPAQGRGCPGSDIPPGHVHALPRSTEAPAPAPQPQPQPQPRPRPEGADVIRSRGPSRLAAGMTSRNFHHLPVSPCRGVGAYHRH